MKFEKFHFIDYLSMGLLVSLLFFTVFSSSYLSEKRATSTRADGEGDFNYTDYYDIPDQTQQNETFVFSENSTPVGDSTTNSDFSNADSYSNTLLGSDNIITSNNSTAVGDSTTNSDFSNADSYSNTLLGSDNIITSNNSTAVGGTPDPNSPNATAVGNGGAGSNATGVNSNATGGNLPNSTAINSSNAGDYSTATGIGVGKFAPNPDLPNSTAINSSNAGDYSTATGTNVTPKTAPKAATNTVADSFAKALATSMGTALNRIIAGTPTAANGAVVPNVTAKPYPSPTPKPQSLVEQSTFSNDIGVGVTAYMKLKVQGISKVSNTQFPRMPVKVILVDTTTGKVATDIGDFVPDADGYFIGKVEFKNVRAGDGYQMLVKSSKQTQKKVCSIIPKETDETLKAGCSGTFTIEEGDNALDLTGVVLLSGDIDQNGVINAKDLGYVTLKLGRKDYSSLSISDLNFDGAINSLDYSIAIQSWNINDTDQK